MNKTANILLEKIAKLEIKIDQDPKSDKGKRLARQHQHFVSLHKKISKKEKQYTKDDSL